MTSLGITKVWKIDTKENRKTEETAKREKINWQNSGEKIERNKPLLERWATLKATKYKTKKKENTFRNVEHRLE